MMWGAFFASGDPAYPERLIDVLDPDTALSGNATLDLAYRGAAAWSLSSNMRQHDRVYEMIRRDAQQRTGVTQQLLLQMLAAYASKNAFPDHSGEFGAELVLISENELTEFSKPSDQGLHLDELDRIKPGQHVAIKLVFQGMALTNDLRADVTYDLKMTSPDGTIIQGFDKKGLEAFRRKIAVRFGIFDNSGVMNICFAA